MKMNKDLTTDLKKNELAVPDFMQPAEVGKNPLGLELATTYEQPQFTKIIQPLTKDKAGRNDGDMLLSPDNQLLVPMGEKFTFVPIFYFFEYCKQYNGPPVQGRDWIVERTFDPNSELAQRCRSRDENENTEFKDGDKLVCRQHDRYVIVLLDHNELIGDSPIIHTFQGGEAKYGNAFRRLLKSRRAPIFGCVFQAQISLHSGKKGQWYGLDVFNPEDHAPFLEEQLYTRYEQYYKAAHKAHTEAGGIIIDYTEDEDVIDATSTPVEVVDKL